MKITLKNISEILFLACIVTLPFSTAIINITFACFLISIIALIIKDKNKISINLSDYVLISLFIFLMVNGIFQGSFSANKTLWKFTPLLTIGYFLIRNYHSIDRNKFKNISILSCLVFIIFILGKIINYYISNGNLPLANGEYVNQILKIERPYLGFYIVLNSIFIFENILQKNKYYAFYIAIALLFVGFLIFISARLSVLSILILSAIYLFFYSKINLLKKAILSVSFIAGIVFLVNINPNFKERIQSESVENFINEESRFVIWESVFNIQKNEDFNKLYGYGNNNLIKDYLLLNYEENIENQTKRDYFLSEKFNTHSQFFDMYLFGGIIALVLIFSFYILNLYQYRLNYFNCAIIVAFLLFFLFENVFHRQLGCYLFLLYFATLKQFKSEINSIK